MNNSRTIRHNKIVHDRAAQNYDARHGEIYNPTEQQRINRLLHETVNLIETGSEKVFSLDYGAGTGNITNHLLGFGFNVLAADVSPTSLSQITTKSADCERLNTCVLNGKDLSNFKDNTFDLITSYSVLHHVPDYLTIIEEFVRVLKPGGVIYIDHEVCTSYWELSKVYLSYLEELGGPFIQEYLFNLDVSDNRKGRVANFVMRMKKALARGELTGLVLRELNFINDEGDIHITKKDHIRWDEIKIRLLPSCEVLLEDDYLVCRESTEPAQVWAKWRDTVTDMRMMVSRKKRG